jgi:DNA glycosylase AlkZ-like
LIKSKLTKEENGSKTYWSIKNKITKQSEQDGYLLPGFDEYFIAYKDRGDVLNKEYAKELNQGGGMVNGAVIIKGHMVGGWKRKFSGKNVSVIIRLFEKIPEEQKEAIKSQTERFEKFLNIPTIIELQ